jgi:transposase
MPAASIRSAQRIVGAQAPTKGRGRCARPALVLPFDARADRRLPSSFGLVLEGLAFERLIGDRGSDTDAIRDWGAAHGIEAVIPSKRNRKAPILHDREAYKRRHKVENLFGRIKDLGRIVLRKGKTSRRYAGRLRQPRPHPRQHPTLSVDPRRGQHRPSCRAPAGWP